MKLTKSAVDAAQPRVKDYFLWCSELPGFGVRVASSGRKTYVVRYRNKHGSDRMLKLSRTCDMPPNQARDMARKVFADVAEGRDPTEERKETRNAITVADLCERYLSEHAKPYKKPRSVKNDEFNITLHVLPAMGKKNLKEVTQSDIQSLHAKLSHIKPTANRVLALLSKMFALAETWKLRDPHTNPVKGVQRYKEKARETILSKEQLERVFLHLKDEDIPESFELLVRLLLLTGCRLSEVLTAKTEWIDWERKLLLLPDSKVGARKIPLSRSAMELLQGVKGQEYIVKGRLAGTHLAHPWGIWERIRMRANIPKVRLHDLRHTVGSMAHKAGLSQKEIAQLLGHRQLSTTERYLHGYEDDAVRNAEIIANLVA